MLEIKFGYSWEYKGKRGKETLFHTAIGNFVTELRNWAPAFRMIAQEVFEPFVARQFSSQGEEGGTSWQTLAPSTIHQKGSDRILYRDGMLEGSFRSGGPDHVEEIDRQSLRWGSLTPYALFHQTGTGKGFQQTSVLIGPGTGRGVAMRKILVMTEAMKRRMRSYMVGRLSQIARAEGYSIAQSAGMEDVGPLQARQIGQNMLGLT